MTQQSSQRGFKRIKFYLPEDGIYCAAQEALPRFRRQEFGSEDRHELVEIDLSITWHNETKKDYGFVGAADCKWHFNLTGLIPNQS